MCTAATYKTKDFYFGRTLDVEFSYSEQVAVAPRKFPFEFRREGRLDSHYAIIGTAFVCDGYPLYYDAMNEVGLCMAGLNFVGNAFYRDEEEGKINLAQYELIPYILGKCRTVDEAERLFEQINVINLPFNKKLPVAQLHWIIADKDRAITVESVREGIKIYDNPVGVLTNNPPFDIQLFNLNNYISLSSRKPENRFSDKIDLQTYSRGMGALGLPGDLSSQSRFVRAAFTKLNSVSGESEEDSVNQFFHILGSVEQQRGCCILNENDYEITSYTSCCNADRGIYYYTTYENHSLSAVDMHRENLDSQKLVAYPLKRREEIFFHN
ncbi:MAG: choloylglycine hydrolase [Candidatus Coproplasma sp.]